MHELLEGLGFVRTGGSAEELKAAQLIQKMLKDNGGLEARIEDFDVQAGEIQEVVLEVTKPYQKRYNATGYLCGGNTPEEGITAEFLYFEADSDVLRKKADNKIVMINGHVGMLSYKQFAQTGALGFITYSGNIDYAHDFDLGQSELRQILREKWGTLPGVHIKVEDAMEMVALGATEVRMVVKGTTGRTNSRNVVLDIDGWENKDTIICTAHYDSAHHSKGYYDNASGSVALYDMALYFAKHQPRHHLRFLWCGSEERGLLGSKAYVLQHPEDIDAIKLCVNVDMIGNTMGNRIAVCTSDESLVHYIDYLGKEVGFPIKASQGVYSSDSTALADKDIPAVSFARIAHPGTANVHSRHDVIEHLNQRILLEDIAFVQMFTERMANAFVVPVPRKLPANIRKEVDVYVGRDE